MCLPSFLALLQFYYKLLVLNSKSFFLVVCGGECCFYVPVIELLSVDGHVCREAVTACRRRDPWVDVCHGCAPHKPVSEAVDAHTVVAGTPCLRLEFIPDRVAP